MDINRPYYGVHEHFRLTVVPDGVSTTLLHKPLTTVGALTTPGVYRCDVETRGLSAVVAHLKPSAVTGAFAPSLIIPFLDGTADETAAGANFIAGTDQRLTLSPAGRSRLILTFTIPAGGAVTFARAEISGL